jgi:hypothetical protein
MEESFNVVIVSFYLMDYNMEKKLLRVFRRCLVHPENIFEKNFTTQEFLNEEGRPGVFYIYIYSVMTMDNSDFENKLIQRQAELHSTHRTNWNSTNHKQYVTIVKLNPLYSINFRYFTHLYCLGLQWAINNNQYNHRENEPFLIIPIGEKVDLKLI